MSTTDSPSEYPLTVEVDGESFLIARDPEQEGVYHYEWASGQNTGYGFTTGFAAFDEASGQTSHDHQPTLAEHIEGIRDFLGQVDPQTGYIEDE